jgi:hypothetical protein
MISTLNLRNDQYIKHEKWSVPETWENDQYIKYEKW